MSPLIESADTFFALLLLQIFCSECINANVIIDFGFIHSLCRRSACHRVRVLVRHVAECAPAQRQSTTASVGDKMGFDWLKLNYDDSESRSRDPFQRGKWFGRWIAARPSDCCLSFCFGSGKALTFDDFPVISWINHVATGKVHASNMEKIARLFASPKTDAEGSADSINFRSTRECELWRSRMSASEFSAESRIKNITKKAMPNREREEKGKNNGKWEKDCPRRTFASAEQYFRLSLPCLRHPSDQSLSHSPL